METQYHRAFGITDAVADARELFSHNNQDVSKVNVNYQHDIGSGIFEHSNGDGAYYVGGSINTIYLNGLDTRTTEPDDSEQRWTILHEWGHHQMNDAFSGSPIGCIGDHFISQANTEGCVWKECWAGIWVCHAHAPVWEYLQEAEDGEQILHIGNPHDWIDPFWIVRGNQAMHLQYNWEYDLKRYNNLVMTNDDNDDYYLSSSSDYEKHEMNRAHGPDPSRIEPIKSECFLAQGVTKWV